MLSGYKLFFSKFGREMNLEMTEAKFFRMLILMMAIHIVHMQDAGTTGQSCVDNSQPPSTTYWTDWYSTEDSLTDTGEQEDFSEVCTPIQETECRERFTHLSLGETGLSFTEECEDGVLLCENSGGSAAGTPSQVCVDMEMRLKCAVPNDQFPEPDFQWSLNELDSGSTRGAVRPWKCSDEPLVQLVTPIKGSIFGYADGKGMKQRYGPNSQFNRCAVATNGLSSLAFQPFVQSCLTDIACCNQIEGITVSFWLRNGADDNDDRSLPIHVFRSPYLIATLQEDHLVVSCYHGDGTSTKRAEVPRSEWRFVTLSCNTDLQIYFSSREVTEETSHQSLDGARLSLDEFRAANTSFHLLTVGDSEGLTSSDIRPISITDLRVYYGMLSPEDVERVFQHEQDRDLPAKVIRMTTQGHRFISFTEESTKHVFLKCMVRVYTDETDDEARLRVRFMHTDDVDNGPFEEMTSEDFKMRVYRRRKSGYEVQMRAQILGRTDGAELPQYFTCDVAADSSLGNISNYGFEIISVQSIAEYAEPAYYWTKFFDSGPPDNDGDETEDRTDHKIQANQESYELLCESPAYAECRVKGSNVPWYDWDPSFLPQYEFPCDSAGISCESQGDGQTCPDLEVRYACLNTKFENEQGESSTGGSDPRSDSDGQVPNSRQPSNTEDPSNGNTQLPNSGQPSTTMATGQSSNDVIGDSDPDLPPANNSDNPPRPTTTNGLTKKPFDMVIRDNLNWIYPVLIVSLGAGIPTLIACYFLCRKKTPEEIKAEILAAEKKKEAEMMKMGAMGASDKP